MIEPHRGKAFRGIERRAAEKFSQKTQVFPSRSRRLQRVAVAEIMGLLGQGQFSSPPSRSIDPSAIVRQPAISRSSEVLPAQLGPVTARRQEWLEIEPENTSRPLRTHLTPRPKAAFCPFTALGNMGTASEFVVPIAAAPLPVWAVLLERFYKPELDAAHNPPRKPSGHASQTVF